MAAAAWLSIAAAGAAPVTRLEQYVLAVQSKLPSKAVDALSRIDGESRRLLATRAYLRAADRLESRWSWSDAEVDRYERSAEYQALLREIALVQARFEAANPGYSLYANTEVRSLDRQLERWNTNPAVARVARSLHDAAVVELKARSYSARPDAASTKKFADFLARWTPTPAAAPLAAPGLSLHGRARAIDFQVMHQGRVAAGTEVTAVASVWSKQGWGRKLHDAVQGTRFKGPLASPDEPWHYEYQP
jgi:hypothetical protein